MTDPDSPEIPLFDADNHYYEATDAFTRHLDPRLGPRTVEWGEFNGRRYHVVGGRVARVVSNPTFDPIAKPGALYGYFRGNAEGKRVEEYLRDREPIRPEYLDPRARLKVMDEQGLARAWMFPTLGVLYEELLKHDPWAVGQTFKAFNRWVADDWGLNHRDRIFAAPYITLADLDVAIGEVEWALANGCRVMCIRGAAPTTTTGQRSPSDPYFDPFWARVNEAGLAMVVHAGDAGYSTNGYADQKFKGDGTFDDSGAPSVKMFALERAVHDFLATLVFGKLFDRFPNLRFASVENGSSFVPGLLGNLSSTAKKVPGYFTEDPVETFKRHVWVNPFWEDDVSQLAEIMGADRVIFGSDWPHIEGLARPLDYLDEVKGMTDGERAKILGGNTAELNTPRAA
jgi:predicted TIM-barrel fold metal-dependent hydrolase